MIRTEIPCLIIPPFLTIHSIFKLALVVLRSVFSYDLTMFRLCFSYTMFTP
jgi:hypothetical protein